MLVNTPVFEVEQYLYTEDNKLTKAYYFISGEFTEDTNGEYHRNNGGLLSCDLICIDIEDTKINTNQRYSVMALVCINYDTKSYTWSQLSGLSIVKKGNKHIFIKHLDGLDRELLIAVYYNFSRKSTEEENKVIDEHKVKLFKLLSDKGYIKVKALPRVEQRLNNEKSTN